MAHSAHHVVSRCGSFCSSCSLKVWLILLIAPGVTIDSFYGAKSSEGEEQDKEVDLASVVKRRRLLATKAAHEKKKKQEEERIRYLDIALPTTVHVRLGKFSLLFGDNRRTVGCCALPERGVASMILCNASVFGDVFQAAEGVWRVPETESWWNVWEDFLCELWLHLMQHSRSCCTVIDTVLSLTQCSSFHCTVLTIITYCPCFLERLRVLQIHMVPTSLLLSSAISYFSFNFRRRCWKPSWFRDRYLWAWIATTTVTGSFITQRQDFM